MNHRVPVACLAPCFSRLCHGCVALAGWLAFALALGDAGSLSAGGGPENVLLVVNPRSWASLTVANHYAALRAIPRVNVLYLDYAGPLSEIDVGRYRREILEPVLRALQERQIGDHIDYVVFSSDFPLCINASDEFAALKLPPPHVPVGSLTGLTYLWSDVAAHRPDFVGLNANRYVRPVETRPGVAATHGFRGWYGWGDDGALLEAGGRHYLLSTMLAYTSWNGNSVPEAIHYLTTAAAADGTRPQGTIYYLKSADVRSTTRQPGFDAAVRQLEQLGVAARVMMGHTPLGRSDVQGAMLGIDKFSWPTTHSTILPGAICEHLTSYGGQLYGSGQTPLCEFLRYGAAGASGAVVEPFAIQAKFPLPSIHVHYARGCSLAEAFYQSVAAPYQLLIVGDPLCRPWAKIPQVSVTGLAAETPLSGAVPLVAQASLPGEAKVDRCDWFVDGVRLETTRPGETYVLETTRLRDGAHELRVVACEPGPIESQGRAIVPFQVRNGAATLEFTSSDAPRAVWGDPLILRVKAPGATAALVFHGTRALGQVQGEKGVVNVDPRLLGQGPVSLHAVAIVPGAPGGIVQSASVDLLIEPNAPSPSVPLEPSAKLARGFLLTPGGGRPKPIDAIAAESWLRDNGVGPDQPYAITSVFEAEETAVYQFQVRYTGKLAVRVDGRVLHSGESPGHDLFYLPVSLAAGPHRLEISGQSGNPALAEIRFGCRGLTAMGAPTFKHLAAP